jgi:hypothetical protein
MTNTVPKAVQISKLSLGVYIGASPLARKFLKIIKHTILQKFLNANLTTFLRKFSKNQRRNKKGVSAG